MSPCQSSGKKQSTSSHKSSKFYLLFLDSSSFWNLGGHRVKPAAATSQYKLQEPKAPHSSTLAWRIPWMEKPGGLQSVGSLRVGHDWATSLSLLTFMHWRRKWQPTPVFLPRESQGLGSLVGYRLWGRTESDTTEVTYQQQQQQRCRRGLVKICSGLYCWGGVLK